MANPIKFAGTNLLPHFSWRCSGWLQCENLYSQLECQKSHKQKKRPQYCFDFDVAKRRFCFSCLLTIFLLAIKIGASSEVAFLPFPAADINVRGIYLFPTVRQISNRFAVFVFSYLFCLGTHFTQR